ncbi:hypothetical protein ACFPYJ_16065 [Paenibacillus solisilvae]|uniref:Uncharacterized protein n=1 Tax=Paenibacillus solisilvae TaxID=2486751 RepID=A0ABW0W0W8_9BACL
MRKAILLSCITLLVISIFLWFYRWEDGPDLDVAATIKAKITFDRLAKQSWRTEYSFTDGKTVTPTFTEELIDNKVKEVIDDVPVENESTLALKGEVTQFEHLVSEISDKIQSSQDIQNKSSSSMDIYYKNATKLRNDKTTSLNNWVFFPPDIEGSCWVIDTPRFTKDLSKQQLTDVNNWCSAQKAKDQLKLDLDKANKQLYQQQASFDLRIKGKAEAMLTDQAWDSGKPRLEKVAPQTRYRNGHMYKIRILRTSGERLFSKHLICPSIP